MEPVDAFVVHQPAFAPQQHVQAAVAIADPNRS
jgi:hypothetical protein